MLGGNNCRKGLPAMFEDLLDNDYKMYGAALIGFALVAQLVLRRYMRLWLWAVLSLTTVVGIGLLIVGINPPS